MTQELINQYMKDLHEQAIKCNAECAAMDKEIADLQHQLEVKADQRNKLAAPFDAAMDVLREQIEILALEAAKSFDCEYGQVKYKKGSERRSWNLDAMDDICEADEELKKKIWPFRKVSTTDPSVTIELDG